MPGLFMRSGIFSFMTAGKASLLLFYCVNSIFSARACIVCGGYAVAEYAMADADIFIAYAALTQNCSAFRVIKYLTGSVNPAGINSEAVRCVHKIAQHKAAVFKVGANV